MTVGFVKELLYGQNVSLHAPADVFHLYEELKSGVHPEDFNPLIPVTGGFSFVIGGGGEDRSLQALVFGQDWLCRCHDIGADTKNAVICLASNFDDHAGMVALALELAMIAHKPKTPGAIFLDEIEYLEVLKEVYAKDYGGIHTAMSKKWGVELKEGVEIPVKRTRSVWREELGYDVLIHPVTLEPCRDESGEALQYFGTVHDEATDRCFFRFSTKSGEENKSPTFALS